MYQTIKSLCMINSIINAKCSIYGYYCYLFSICELTIFTIFHKNYTIFKKKRKYINNFHDSTKLE